MKPRSHNSLHSVYSRLDTLFSISRLFSLVSRYSLCRSVHSPKSWFSLYRIHFRYASSKLLTHSCTQTLIPLILLRPRPGWLKLLFPDLVFAINISSCTPLTTIVSFFDQIEREFRASSQISPPHNTNTLHDVYIKLTMPYNVIVVRENCIKFNNHAIHSFLFVISNVV